MKLEFSQQILYTYSDTKFHENKSSGGELLQADGQTDRHDESISCLLQFHERA